MPDKSVAGAPVAVPISINTEPEASVQLLFAGSVNNPVEVAVMSTVFTTVPVKFVERLVYAQFVIVPKHPATAEI